MKQAITKALLPLVLTVGLSAQYNATLYNVSSVAGSVPSGQGNGGPANAALFLEADGVTVDAAGNTYVSDSVRGNVRKIAAGTGTISNFISLGTSIFGLTTDAAGNVYMAVTGWHAVIKCGPNCNPAGVVASATVPFSAGGYVFVAGNTNHVQGYAGDNYPAAGTTATGVNLSNGAFRALYSPHGVAVDAAGNVYIADTTNNRIRKVDTAGIIHTIAGTGAATAPTLATSGTQNFALPFTCPGASTSLINLSIVNVGDGCPATEAIVNAPWDVKVGPDGNIYFTDTGNNRVRVVNTSTGIISTFAGTGAATLTTGNYAGGATNAVLGDGNLATVATLKTPYYLAFDANGNLFVSDNGNLRVRKINTSGVISSYGPGNTNGNGVLTAGFTSPRQITFDNSGNLVIADGLQVKAIDPTYLVLNPIIGRLPFAGDNGPATSALLNGAATGVAVDGSGNIYISDAANQRVREVSNGIITTVAGTGVAASYTAPTATVAFSTTSGDGGLAAGGSRVNSPGCVAVDSAGSVYIADTSDNRIRKIAAGVISTIVGPSIGVGTPYAVAVLNAPKCVAVDNLFNVYFTEGNSVQKLNYATNTVSIIAGQPSFLGNTLTTPASINGVVQPPVVTGVGTTLVSGPAGNDGDGTPAIQALLNGPRGITVDEAGNIFVADTGNNEIRKITATTGIITTLAGTTYSTGDSGIVPNATTGTITTTTATVVGLSYGAYLNAPQGVAVDAVGNVYIANTASGYIDKIDTNGNLIRIAGNSSTGPASLVETGPANGAFQQILSPTAITVDMQGNVYFSDRIGLVRKLTPVNATK